MKIVMTTKTQVADKKKVATKKRVQKPRHYKVVMMNDDFTPMDFVVLVLEKVFDKSPQAATKIMKKVHNTGSAVAGIFHFELAEMKAHQANAFAHSQQYPLQCVLKKARPSDREDEV